MTVKKTPYPVAPLLIQFIIPAIVFIGSAAVLYSKVNEIGETLKETTVQVQKLSERLARVETKVQYLSEK